MTHSDFASLPLPPEQLTNLASLGYKTMTPIQIAALPAGLAGQDIVAKAKTGSGKTAAFGLPLLQDINPRFFGCQGLVLCPTRELATQVAGEIRRLARYQDNIKVVVLCGGQPIGPQIGSLEHGAHIVVGTPGRLRDHLRKKTLNLESVKTLVLDEADRMLEMGFLDDIADIIGHTPKRRQTLFFSATYPQEIEGMSQRFQRSPQKITLESMHGDEHISQHLYVCPKSARLEGLVTLLNHYQPEAAVVFCNTRQLCADVCDYLEQHGINAGPLHGEMDQRDRDQTLIRFRQQSLSVLVATDVAARGLDIDDLPAVVNFELPRDSQVYVHRIGRTGRAGKSGLALSLFAESELHKLERINSFLDRALEFEPLNRLPAVRGSMPDPKFTTLCISGGRKDKIRPGDILGALTKDADIDGTAVGKIDITDHSAYVALHTEVAGRALGRLLNGKIKGRKFKVRKL